MTEPVPHQHEDWQLDEEGKYCRACGATVASPVVTPSS